MKAKQCLLSGLVAETATAFMVYGRDGIDDASLEQMHAAMRLPVAVGGALMPDAHLGYGLPIGGVLALDNAVCPYAVGVDIACRMKLSVFPIDPRALESEKSGFISALEQATHFGIGVENNKRYDHPVLHEDWGVSPVTRDSKDKARRQLGTSGSGNHFVEWGVYTQAGESLVALLSHSGSRGAGAAVCNHYSKLAKKLRPEFGDLAWLDLDSELGQEYWAAMNLMGQYAAANHCCIHDEISRLLDIAPGFTVENHHNFAWKEQHGREVIVHRKGATPAGSGELGVIPGSMGSPAFVVRGKGNPLSLCSASHGAGRVMSRKQAKKVFNYKEEMSKLESQGITVLSAGADEVPGVYKNIEEVMAAQQDLVDVLGRFDPKIVKMCGDKSRAED